MIRTEIDDINALTPTAIYHGGIWNLGEGVILRTDYDAQMHWFDWSLRIDGVSFDYGLDCEEPTYVIGRAFAALQTACGNADLPLLNLALVDYVQCATHWLARVKTHPTIWARGATQESAREALLARWRVQLHTPRIEKGYRYNGRDYCAGCARSLDMTIINDGIQLHAAGECSYCARPYRGDWSR